MDRGGVGEERGGKEIDGCPLTGLAQANHQHTLYNNICDLLDLLFHKSGGKWLL
jgi:hypothetical protein